MAGPPIVAAPSSCAANQTLEYLIPDGKVQVGVEFKARSPHRIHSVTITASQRAYIKPSLRRMLVEAGRVMTEPGGARGLSRR